VTRSKVLIAVIAALVVIAAALMMWNRMAPGSQAPAANASEFTSQQGLFTLSYRSDTGSIPLNELHAWTLHVEDSSGQPVTGARIRVDGRMPAHNHGLPTAPQVTAELGNGDYRVEGLRFQMTGEWVVEFTIQTERHTDVAAVIFTLR